MPKFKLTSEFKPEGDQPKAIQALTKGILDNEKFQTLLGVTGSGKTFTIASVIENIQKPTLVISHNKTLAAQLYSEFKEFFPKNAVEYFVSYYDYYQPEAYIPTTDIYIEKDSSINDEIDKLRLAATSSLMSRKDVVIVASVSAIYGLGSPEDYAEYLLELKTGSATPREKILENLIHIHYERNDIDFSRGKFRVKGEVLEIHPAYGETAIRLEMFGDKIEHIKEIDPLTGKTIADLEKIVIYPAKHFVTSPDKINAALKSINEELTLQLKKFKSEGKLLEAQRLESRTRYDMEMMKELGFCSGIENYSRHLAGRPPGSRPFCLLDYFPKDFLLVIDESHVTIPQIRGMYEGDRARKETLVNFGFRLPSALDNRPLKFEEFEKLINQVIFASATPSDYEKSNSKNIVEQIIRPTGLVDPEIIVKSSKNQIDDLIGEIKTRAKNKERVIVTTLTKRMAEDLTAYLKDVGLRVKYLHSEIDVLERVQILRELRLMEFDCIVGINLLREGIDLPEVSLVAILDADKEGFLRSETSLIQVAGRAARNVNGQVIMYADEITKSMKKTIDETERRRKIQSEFNRTNNITPRSIEKKIIEGIESYRKAKEIVAKAADETEEAYEMLTLITEMEKEMELAARNLQFERAAALRDEIKMLKTVSRIESYETKKQ